MKNNFLADKNAFTVISIRFLPLSTVWSVFLPCKIFRALPRSCICGDGNFVMIRCRLVDWCGQNSLCKM